MLFRSHKKESISHQKLDLLIKSLELSIGQPWVNDSEWNNIIPDIIALLDMMRKYSEHLVKSRDPIRFFRGHSDWIRISTTESGLQFEFKNITDDHLNSDSIRNSNQFGFWVNSDFHKFWTNPDWNSYFKSIRICT